MRESGGIVQIAIWKDNQAVSGARELMNFGGGGDVFYDFARPLRLLGSSGWPSVVQTETQEGFFVFSVNDSSYLF